MRELERDSSPLSASTQLAVVGAGRLGTALAAALRAAGADVEGPYGRDGGPVRSGAGVVLLAVPDSAIATVAARLAPGPLVGHLSGATGLDALAPHEAFSLHPLMTFPGTAADPGRFAGAGAAIAGATPRALELARELAELLQMRPFEVAEESRALYHAAASIASNFLVTLEGAAEHAALLAGCPREMLVPLVRATVENWAHAGAAAALTGPVARGDQATVARQRAALAQDAPELLECFDALAAATRALASGPAVAA